MHFSNMFEITVLYDLLHDNELGHAISALLLGWQDNKTNTCIMVGMLLHHGMACCAGYLNCMRDGATPKQFGDGVGVTLIAQNPLETGL